MTHVSRRTLLGSLGAGLLMTTSRNATAAPQTIEAWKKAGEVKIGCEAAYVPFTYRDNTGKIIGFDIDFATKMLEPLGVKPIFIDAVWSGIIPALQAGRFDMIPTMSYTKERLGARAVQHSLCGRLAGAADPRYRQGQDQGDRRPVGQGARQQDRLGRRDAVQAVRRSAQKRAWRRLQGRTRLYDDHPAAYLALAQGSVDGVLNTVPTLSVVLRDKPGTFVMIQGVATQKLSRLRLPQGRHRARRLHRTAASRP